jgi:hypothetical protein
MNASPWRLDGCRARLDFGQLAGTIDLTRPGDGIVGLRGPDGPLLGVRLLGIAIPGMVSGSPQSLIECHVRGRDLAVAYRESASWPARLDAVWRGVAVAGSLAAVELVLSVRTYTLACRPALAVRTLMKSDDVLGTDPSGAFRDLPPRPEGWSPLCSGRPRCVVLRGDRWSYAEMTHPGDSSNDELLREMEPIVPVQLRHRLFVEPLEKGVLLRARLRGFFLPRDDDLRLAAAAVEEFAATETPLD